jgi:hypothetical protein
MDPVTLPPINPDEQAELDNLFTYHRPFGDQPARYEPRCASSARP